MSKKGKSSAQNYTGLDDGYFENQSGDGRGGPVSAFFLRDTLQKLNLLFKLLWNQDPNETRYNKPTGDGHNHDGANSSFIGNTVAAQVRQPFDTAEQFDVTSAAAWDTKNRWANPIMYNNYLGSFSRNTPTLDRLYFGPGANRARLWLLWTAVAPGNPNCNWIPAMGAGNFEFTLTCENTAASVVKSVPVLYTAPFIQWSEITGAESLAVEPEKLNRFNLSLTSNPGGETCKVVIYGFVIREGRQT